MLAESRSLSVDDESRQMVMEWLDVTRSWCRKVVTFKQRANMWTGQNLA
jgi:hypothetical protein